jgi:hypothetical protein
MNFNKAILFLSFLLLVGCMGQYVQSEEVGDQINVFGVALFSNVDYREINGVVATEEPCLRGYERSFDALDIIIGYGFDRKIRRINTRNPNTSLFGVSPGMRFREGKTKILQAGLKESTSPYTFGADRYSLTLLVDENQKIFGLTVELVD